MQKQKIIGGIGILVVLITQSFANWVIFGGKEVQASGPVEDNKIVALFVENAIYPAIKSDIERYTTKYIQARFARTKVLVFPVDTQTIHPTDIQKILNNLYHGGEKDTPSTLISTVLVGNIPLPVIQNEERIFPSIIPYTDIEKPRYIFDEQSSYFVPTTSTPDNRQELSHGLIRFATTQEYTSYFQKLQAYANNPASFAEQKFWFEDFTRAEQTFTDQNVPLYIQGQLHDEDLTYHRFAPTLFGLLQKNNNDTSLDILQNIQTSSSPISADYGPEYTSLSQSFNSSLSSRSNSLSSLANQGKQELQAIGNGEEIPTLVMGQSIVQQTKPYESLFSAEYGDVVAKEIESSARWTGTNVSSHITKASTVDKQTSRILLGLNTMLEKALDKKKEEEKRDLNIPIPVIREKYNCTLGVPTTLAYTLENFYFGKNAWDITSAEQTTWYRGTFGNYSLDQIPGLARGGNQGDSTSTLLRSIGATFGFTNQQVIASRGYNALNAKADADAYNTRRRSCGRNDVSFATYIEQFWGGNTPINLDGNTMQLKYNKWDQAFNPSYNTGIGGALFDIAGSRLTTTGVIEGTTAQSATTFGRFLQTKPGRTGILAFGNNNTNYQRCDPKNPIPVASSDYFVVSTNTTNKDIQVIPPNIRRYDASPTCKDRYVYKTISSVVKHTSPTKEEVEKMNITTRDRPIDARRYVSFQSLGGNNISLQYPNLYNVEVYNRNGNNITLKSVNEIEAAIINYLENKVNEYNSIFSGENSRISGYVANKLPALNALAAKDSKASPVGRSYNLLPTNFFVQALGANAIRQLAQSLYLKNSGWPIKSPSSNVGDAIKNLESQFSIGSKIYATLENNLVVGQQGIGVISGGYEAGYIRADGTNDIRTKTTPSLIENADARIQADKNATNELDTNSDKLQAQIDQACNVGGDGTVPLLKWPSSLVCWWKNLRKTSLKDAIKISYKNAQGPVLPLRQFASDLNESYEDYTTYVQNVLGSNSIQNNTITSVKLEIPTTRVLRGSQIPFSILATNQAGETVSNLLFPIEITSSTGEILTPGQATTRLETTSTNDPFVFDTRTISSTISTISLTARGPLDPGIATGSILQDSKQITLVDGTLQTQINNQSTNNFSIVLQNSGYTATTRGIVTYLDNLMPTLSLRLTDTGGQPLSSAVTITSENGLIQPGLITTGTEQTIGGTVTRSVFTKQNLWTISNGILRVKLLPAMIAGKDKLTIAVPGLEPQIIDIELFAAQPYSVSVSDNSSLASPGVRLSVQDRRGNIVQSPTQIQYTVLGDATTNGSRQGSITVSGSAVLPLTYGQRGGTIYVYGELSTANTQPGYIRKDIPTRLWPTTGLNIVYLTLEGKGWGEPNAQFVGNMISSSPKTIAVTTELFSRQNNVPILGVITSNGDIVSSNSLNLIPTSDTKKTITVDNKVIGYLSGSAPYTRNNLVIENARYGVQVIGYNGSTNNIGFGITEIGGDRLEQPEQNLGPIRSYAGGLPVGEAQKSIFDEARINYGDPFLQHKDAMQIVPTSNNTTITLYSDLEKTIKKTMEIDLDKDGKKDLVVLYDDDTIRFLKHYGGTPPYRQLGNLMAVVDGAHDMWIGDADNNGLEDIFIKTKKNTLRVYKNNGGNFDVHGSAVCIDVPSGNTSLNEVRQIFVEDMNNDAIVDIVTYDTSGKIRIFYGGNRGGDGYYISSAQGGCDAQWQTRNQSLTVATYGLQITTNTPIYDDSLIRWQGLTLPDATMQDEEDSDIIPANIASSLPNPTNPTSINIQQLISAGIPETIRFSATPYDFLPAYERNSSLDTIAYIPLQYLTGNDRIDAHKTFAYGQNNDVIVTVNLRANQSTSATYFEQLRGPWEVVKTETGSIAGFNRQNLPNNTTIQRDVDGFLFMLDNITLNAGQTVSFSYPVRYRPVQTTTIGIEDTNNDGWLDITTTPIDSCMPTSLTYISNQGRSYSGARDTTNTSYTSGLNQLQTTINNQLQTTNRASQDLASGSGSIGQIPGMNQIYESWDDFVQNGVDTTSLSFNGDFDINILNDPALEKTIDDAVKGLCQGFNVSGGGKGLPVPFNMAFLAPGDFNIFGCKAGTDKGLPVFFFPGTLQTPVGPVPIPYGQKGPGDGFYWAGGGVYPSMIRIYAAPTLTMGMGVAVCFGPYGAGIRLPNPIRHIAGNCVVIAKRLGKGEARPNTTSGHPNNNTLGGIQGNNGGTTTSRTCTNPTPNPTRPTSPFTLSAFNGSRELPIRPAPVLNTQSLGIVQGTYLGVINFDTLPFATQLGQQQVDKVQLKGGKPIKLQIEGGNVRGLVKCIVNKWLDNQLRYVINNLTNMSINVYLPDISQLLAGFENVRLDELANIGETFKTTNQQKSPAGNILKNLVSKAQGDQTATTQSELSSLGNIMNNPFNALSSWFEQVPLIKVSTRNVTVQVPYIYNEEIIRYTAQAKDYEAQIEKQLEEWNKIIQDAKGTCQKQQTPSQKEACDKQIASYVDTTIKIQQLQRSVKQNLSTLEAYKRFPLELQQWLTISQRYITEITDTVEGISMDLTAWLNTNASRFEKYVDAIILMIGAVKSRQVLIDFSTTRKSKCGQCTVDNYDYYSCTLGLLCPRLPILPIPPFRIPNIYVDLSQIRLGMDVVLPNIHFVPKTITLPALPELPLPPTVNIDITAGAGRNITGSPNIPSIPELPAPPRLPELPSFIPSIDLNLPTLPPAPKVPRLAPAITSTLRVLGVIGRIMCIVKNGIGLVGEKGVKTRIEQMTQRTRNVEPFDSLSITRIQPPLRGFDLRVESYLNFELNFDILYQVLDDLTQGINKQTNKILNAATLGANNISSMSQQTTQGLQGLIDNATINIQGTVDPKDGINLQGYKEPEMVDPSVLRADIQREIGSLKHSEYGEQFASQITAINNLVDTPNIVTPNTDSIHQATTALEGILHKTVGELEEYKQATKEYDTFLETINNAFLINNTSVDGHINASLFNISDKVKDTLKNAEHPMISYITMQENIIDGFSQALKNNSPDRLQMGEFTHQRLSSYFETTKQKIQEVKGYIESPIENSAPIETLAENTRMIAQNIIAPPVAAGTPAGTITPSNTQNIRWDEHNIYTNQTTYLSKKTDSTIFTRFYDFEPISKYSDFSDRVDDQGYIKKYNTSFNVWNFLNPITSLEVAGQSNTAVNLNWQNDGRRAYLIMLSDTIYGNHEHNYTRSVERKYIIAHNSGFDIQNSFIDIPGIGSKRVSNVLGTTIIDTPAFDATAGSELDIMLSLTGNKWSYASIAPLIVTTRGNVIEMRTGAPRSMQETLGVQRWGDTTSPVATARIRNKRTNEIVGEGTTLSVPRNEQYDLIIQWIDDSQIIENDIIDTTNARQTFAGDSATLTNIATNRTLTIIGTARDQSNNQGTQTITVSFTDPTIAINKVVDQGDQREISTAVSTIYPNGFVRFFNQRTGQPVVLTGKEGNISRTDFVTSPSTPNLTGRIFYDADTISLFGADQKRIARIEKRTGKISVVQEFGSSIITPLDFTQNTPSILIVDTTSNRTLFSLYLKANTLNTIQGRNNHTIEQLNDTNGTFAGGSCIKDKSGTCVVYVTRDGNIYAPDNTKGRIGGAYTFEGGVRYTISIDGIDAATIGFTPMPLE